MDADIGVRRALWISVPFNAAGAAAFAFPDAAGRLLGLAPQAPALFRALLALFILMFGAMYGYAASRPVIPRELVAMGAIGKTGAFLAALLCALAGAAAPLTVFGFSGDLLLALIYFRWLATTRKS